jgi:hypothetical protein
MPEARGAGSSSVDAQHRGGDGQKRACTSTARRVPHKAKIARGRHQGPGPREKPVQRPARPEQAHTTAAKHWFTIGQEPPLGARNPSPPLAPPLTRCGELRHRGHVGVDSSQSAGNDDHEDKTVGFKTVTDRKPLVIQTEDKTVGCKTVTDRKPLVIQHF